ncbi:thiamine phosphate synthase [Fructobacillus ficulneus]|uniref:Thiamine-phosphate synthase n=1 Tax=Fructobacillus ficulneus TaxID=157463 RepID=A0A0K8MI79_9LACO|nr:thiamine phosphate synthase [Fructobacillus ficulneus]GAP00272.1 thiamine-phosphate synthase [Fructobacillus ficulneus]
MKFDPKSLGVYFVIGSQNVGGDQKKVLRLVREACAKGATAIQYREKDHSILSRTETIALGQAIRKITWDARVPLYVDDDLPLAIAIHADGIHVGQGDTSVSEIRTQAPDLLVGLSVHDLHELANSTAVLDQVDYLGVGPVFAAQSKVGAKEAIGPLGLATVVAASPVPVVAIGGIDENNCQQLTGTGIAGVAVISALTQSLNLAHSIQKLKE